MSTSAIKTINEMKIPGAALASTIKVLAGLGSLGERVLKEHGITQIDNDSPLVNSIDLNSIILEAQKTKIRSSKDLNEVVKQVLNSNQKTILLVIYNSQNQRRYIGIKLN